MFILPNINIIKLSIITETSPIKKSCPNPHSASLSPIPAKKVQINFDCNWSVFRGTYVRSMYVSMDQFMRD